MAADPQSGREGPDGTDAVAVLGLWHLGSIAAAGWSTLGKRVFAWDPDPTLRHGIASGIGPVVEPGLEEALTQALEAGMLTVVDEPLDAIRAAGVVHLAFDTRTGEDGLPNDPRLDAAVELFASSAPPQMLLAISSQIPVGTCARWRQRLARAERGLLLAYVPENLRLGRALDDFLHPSRVVIGADVDEAHERAADLFAPADAPALRVSLASAEMAKHATNAYLGLCVAFANDLAWLALAAGADPAEVGDALRADPRVSPSAPLRPGAAFSGATLARDLSTLRTLGVRHGRSDLFAGALASNDRHSEIAIGWLEDELGGLAGTQIAIAGLTYKPGTSTLRDSLPLRIAERLLAAGARVAAWDPHAESFPLPPGMERAASLAECVERADALAVLTALPELASVRWDALRPARRLLVDGCLAVDPQVVQAAGWSYRGLRSRVAGA